MSATTDRTRGHPCSDRSDPRAARATRPRIDRRRALVAAVWAAMLFTALLAISPGAGGTQREKGERDRGGHNDVAARSERTRAVRGERAPAADDVAQSDDRVNFVQVFGDDEYRSQDPNGVLVAAEIQEVMDRNVGRLVPAVADESSDDNGTLDVSFAVDIETGAVVQEVSFPLDTPGTSSHVLFLDHKRAFYRTFTLNPGNLNGDVLRISRYLTAKETPSEQGGEPYIQANLLDLHGRRLALEANASILGVQSRRPYCTMTGHVQVDTWEPARLPVAKTDITSIGLGYPSTFRLRTWGSCWAAREVDVRWDGDLWTTHWRVYGCSSLQKQSGTVFIGAVQSQSYNDDFPLNTSRVWVSHLLQLFHDDHRGIIWYRGYYATAGGVSQSMLASGINIANTYARSNC